MPRLSRIWIRLRASFWFLPALIVLASVVLGVLLVEFDARQDTNLAAWSPRLFGASAEGSRGMLSAIATSMVTVAGVVFSITIVTLSLTSTQYSPRVLRNFMRDSPTQVVLGVFVGIFGYCLVVLRTIRGGDAPFIPSLSVVCGMAYALVGIAVLIYFIHHVALSIQAASILDRIASDTEGAIDRLFPEQLGGPPPEQDIATAHLPVTWWSVPAPRSGYVQSVDAQSLLKLADQRDCVLRMRTGIGAYISKGDTLLEVSGIEPEDRQDGALCACVAIGRQRTVDQDAAFGLEQLVDVALRALSPGVNDPSTARMCLHAIGTLLGRLADRSMPTPFRFLDGTLRVIAPAPDFRDLALLAVRPIVRHGGNDPDVMGSLVGALETTADRARHPDRRQAVLALARELQRPIGLLRPRRDGKALQVRLRRLQQRLLEPARGPRPT